MHEITVREAVITVIENSKPNNPKAPNIVTVDIEGKRTKMKAWPDLNPSSWALGDTLKIQYETEDKVWDKGPYKEHTIRKAMHHRNIPALNGPTPMAVRVHSDDFPSPRPADVGPHLGMWEKEAFGALLAGKTSSEVIIMGIEARQVAREILKFDLDKQQPEKFVVGSLKSAEFDDNLEDSF